MCGTPHFTNSKFVFSSLFIWIYCFLLFKYFLNYLRLLLTIPFISNFLNSVLWSTVSNILDRHRGIWDKYNIQQTFQPCFNVIVRLIYRRSVGQREINIETTLFMSMLEFTTLNNVESTLFISTLIWTTLGNVETTLPLSTLIYKMLSHVETTLWIWPLKKMENKLRAKYIIITLSFKKKMI